MGDVDTCMECGVEIKTHERCTVFSDGYRCGECEPARKPFLVQRLRDQVTDLSTQLDQANARIHDLEQGHELTINGLVNAVARIRAATDLLDYFDEGYVITKTAPDYFRAAAQIRDALGATE